MVRYQTTLRIAQQGPRFFFRVVQLEWNTGHLALPELQTAGLVDEVVLTSGKRELVHKLFKCHLEMQLAVVEPSHWFGAPHLVVRCDNFWVVVIQLVGLEAKDERERMSTQLFLQAQVLRSQVLADVGDWLLDKHRFAEVRRF